MVLLVAVVVLGGLTIALSTSTLSADREIGAAAGRVSALYAAEAGVTEAAALLRTAGGRATLENMAYPRSLGNVTYSVDITYGDTDASLDDDLVRLIGTAGHGEQVVHVQLVLREALIDVVGPGAFGDDSLFLSNHADIDSYDSGLGTWETQATNTWVAADSTTHTYANTGAPAGSNGDVSMEITSSVFGDATPGPTGVFVTDGNGIVTGSTAPRANAVILPPIVVPTLGSAGNLDVSSSSHTLAPGNHRFENVKIDGGHTLTVQGPAVLVVNDLSLKNASELSVDASGGPVAIYVQNKFSLENGSRALPTSGLPQDLALRISSTGLVQKFSNDTEFIGTCYAPDSLVLVENSADVRGSIVGKTLDIVNGGVIHIDEALGDAGTGAIPSLVPTAWRVLSPAVFDALTGGY